MAEPDPDSSDLKPLFSIPSFFVGKDSADPGKSPTSPLDFGVFATFGGLFSPRSPPPPSSPNRNKWVFDKVGLSVLSSSDDCQSDSFRRENIVLAPQIKANVVDTTPKLSSELPKNYAASSLPPDAINILLPHPSTDTNVAEEHNSPRRSTSSPMDIISSQAYSRSLSGLEMALSEDYTCIISHGPNPKTTHIFGDCILDRDPKELGTEEAIEKPQPNFSDSQLCLCTGKSQDCQNIHIHSSEVSAERETENAGVEDSLDISPGSSYNEDFFPMAMPFNP